MQNLNIIMKYLNRLPVSAMVSKKQYIRLVTSHHGNCQRLRRLCRKYSYDAEGNDKTPVKSTFWSRDMSSMSRGSGITL